MSAPLAALVAKDLRLLLRDRSALFFTLLFPLVVALLFGMVFRGVGSPRPLDIGLVVEGNGPRAQAFATALESDGALQVTRYATRDDGVNDVRAGRRSAVVLLGEGFDAGAELLWAGGATVQVLGDPSRTAVLGLLEGKLMEIGYRQLLLQVNDPAALQRQLDLLRALPAGVGIDAADRDSLVELVGAAQKIAARHQAGGTAGGDGTPAPMRNFSPVRIERTDVVDDPSRPPSGFAITFPQGIVWGLAGCVMAFVTSLAAERSTGSLQRLRAAPVSMQSILAGKAVACFVMALAMQALLMALAVGVCGVRPAQPLMLAAVLVANALAFTGVAMAVAAAFQSSAGSEGAGRSIVLVFALIGGGSIPLVFMPPTLATLSAASPFRWAIAALEGPLWRGGTIQDQLQGIGAVLVVAVVSAAVAGLLLVVRRRWSAG